MGRRAYRKTGVLFLGFMVLLSFFGSGCSDGKCEITVEDPIRMGRGDAVLADGTSVEIALEMVRGRYFQADVSVSPYPTNFQGDYQFRVENNLDGKTLYKGAMAPLEDASLCFDTMFDLRLDDYNADGNPDFTVGQYGGGNYNIYKLHTMLPDGTVEEIPIDTGVLMIASKDFSVKLNKGEGGSFSVPQYDNEKAALVEVQYLWEDGAYRRAR